MTELTCVELVELVTAHLDDALDDDTARRFADHLTACDGCRTYLDQVRRTVAELGELPADPLPEPSRDRLLAAFRDWHRG